MEVWLFVRRKCWFIICFAIACKVKSGSINLARAVCLLSPFHPPATTHLRPHHPLRCATETESERTWLICEFTFLAMTKHRGWKISRRSNSTDSICAYHWNVCMYAYFFFFAADSIVLLVSKAYKYERGNAKERQKVDLRFSAHNFLGFVNTHTHRRNMIKTADTRMVSCKKPRNC